MSVKNKNSRRPRQNAEARKRKRTNILVTGLIGIALLGGSVLAFGDNRGEPSAQNGHGAAAFAHIHGLGVDPSDGMLYAGTHYGIFKVPASGEPVQVGPIRDYMGFTVVGPKHFLASGHPGVGENAPSALGLIESTNGGKDWVTLSLSGKADFHALGSRGGVIYGYSGGDLMASADGKTWETRSRPSLRDFAISPRDPNTLLATTSSGVALSTDGGRSFSPLTSAPQLVLVATADNGNTMGLSAEGTVFFSADGGTTWERRGTVKGSPQAMTVTDISMHAATDRAIYDSTDGGRSFTPRYAIKA